MDPNQVNQFALIGLITGIIGTFTGIISLVITAIKELFRDVPIVKVYDIHSRNKFGCVIHELVDPENENIYEVMVTIHLLITNTGLRPTSIVNSKLAIKSKRRSVIFTEMEEQENIFHENLPFSALSGIKLESADFLDCYTSYVGYVDRDFSFELLQGELIFLLSHTEKPLHCKIIRIESVVAYNLEGNNALISEYSNEKGIIVKPIYKIKKKFR
jgi:hypothetical protein